MCRQLEGSENQTEVSPGFGGSRNEHLRCFADTGEEEDICLLENFSLKYLNGDSPSWFYKVWNSVTTVPLYKSDGPLDLWESSQEGSEVQQGGPDECFGTPAAS